MPRVLAQLKRFTNMANNNTLSQYSRFMTEWAVKQLGAKPTAEHIERAHALGVRPGTADAFALAMYLRPIGATSPQVVIATGGTRNNVRRDLIARGAVKLLPRSYNEAGHIVYAVTEAAKAKGVKKPVAKPTSGKAATGKAKGKGKAKQPATVTLTAAEVANLEHDAIHGAEG